MFGFLFWSSLWVVLACRFFCQKSEAVFRKNILLGVTLPAEAHEHPDVLRIAAAFKRQNAIVCGILAILCAAGAFLQDLTVSILCWSGMLLLVLLIPMWLFARFHNKLKKLKREQGWVNPAPQQLRVNIAAMIDYPKPHLRAYLPPAVLCMIPLIFHSQLRWVHSLFLVLVFAGYFLSMICYRRKSETIDADTERTRALSVLRWRSWKQIWLISAYCAMFTSFSVWLTAVSMWAGIVLAVLCAVIFSAAVLGIELQTRKRQEQLTADSGAGWYADEDEYWPGGLFYYNPNDSHVFVNARTGAGSTINMASAGGKIITLAVLLFLAGVLLLLISTALADKSAIVLGADRQTLFCESSGTRYEIPLADIAQIQLLDELPEGLWRTNAVGGQHLFKGSFTGGGMADLKILADPTTPPYLKIETVSGQYYLLGAREPDVAETLFSALTGTENRPVN